MANPHRGETPFEVGGRTYVLCFGTNACAELEEVLSRRLEDIIAELKRWKDEPELMRIKTVRAVIWAGLKQRHKKITVEDVGDLIDQASIEGVEIPLVEAFNRAWPTSEGDGETKGERPTTVNGTGRLSSETSSPSATPVSSSGVSRPGS